MLLPLWLPSSPAPIWALPRREQGQVWSDWRGTIWVCCWFWWRLCFVFSSQMWFATRALVPVGGWQWEVRVEPFTGLIPATAEFLVGFEIWTERVLKIGLRRICSLHAISMVSWFLDLLKMHALNLNSPSYICCWCYSDRIVEESWLNMPYNDKLLFYKKKIPNNWGALWMEYD